MRIITGLLWHGLMAASIAACSAADGNAGQSQTGEGGQGGAAISSSGQGGASTSSGGRGAAVASGSTSTASSSSSSGGTVTWTELYNDIFGPTGTSNCSRSSSCHVQSRVGFQCGTTSTTCYDGLMSAGLVTPGASASSSALVTPVQSPLCGSLGGNMPLVGSCVTPAQLAQIQAWLASGAPDN
jgi:hypothetical protein